MLVIHEREKQRLREALAAENKRHEQTAADLRAQYGVAEAQVKLILADLDTERIMRAEAVIEVAGCYARAGEDRASALAEAIQELTKGGGALLYAYVGTKDYDRWHGQHIRCEYGMCPRHGSVIFRVGLTNAARKDHSLLTDEAISDALYYLHNLDRIQKAKAEASSLTPA